MKSKAKQSKAGYFTHLGQASEGSTGWFSEELSNLASWGLALQRLSLAKRCNVAKHQANEHFCRFMPDMGVLRVSSPFSLLFLLLFETGKKEVQVPLSKMYWANSEIGELLVNSSFFLPFGSATGSGNVFHL